MTVIPTVHIPARELHQLLDMADSTREPMPGMTHDEQCSLVEHWRDVANDVDSRARARAREEHQHCARSES